MSGKVELTPEDIKNGWDEKSLARYYEEREKAQAGVIDITNRRVKPQVQVSYRPLRWRES